ncbi:MAG: leucine-rich repeat protein [Clostridia bacterium]|nr:leucine-rich repeat protein [Clostridia bacterium]
MKKSNKKTTAIILSVILVLAIVPLGSVLLKTTAASYTGKCGDSVNWSLDTSTGVLNITGTGDMATWTTKEAVPWNSYRANVKSVKIADTVTSIGNFAFSSCTKLTSVTMGTGIKTIGKAAFSFCSTLASISIPNSVTSIEMGAFSSCVKLASVSIPASVRNIGDSVFEYCTSLKTISIPDTVTSIGEGAFLDCGYYSTSDNWSNSVLYIGNHLIRAKKDVASSYTIKSGTKTIARFAFSACTGLTSLTASADNANFSSEGGVLFNKDKTVLVQYPIGKTTSSYTIPSTVKNIAYGAFGYTSSKLTTINIPDSITAIDKGAFMFANGITKVTIGNSVTRIGEEAFALCAELAEVVIGNSVTEIAEDAFYCCRKLKTVRIGYSVKTIGAEAFGACHYLNKVYYASTKADWKNVSVAAGNDYLKTASYSYGTAHVHSYTEKVVKAATCSEAGTKEFSCSCGSKYTETIPATGNHTLTHKTVASTCKVAGYEYDYCSVCEGTFNKVDLPLATHTYTSKVTTEATCATAGVRTYTCSVCGDSYTESIPATGKHTLTHKTVASTCKVAGYEYDYCSVCEGTFNKVDLPLATHSYTSEVTTAATCAKAGVRTYTCSVCGNSYTEAIPATGKHNYVGTVTTAATCVKAGVKTYTCTTCSDSYTEAIPATGKHTTTHKTVASTCKAAGYEYDYCSACEGVFNKVDLPLADHTYTSKVTTAATCAKDGVRTYTCVLCSHSYTEVIPATGNHKYTTRVTTAATCAKDGVRTYTCTTCSDSYTEVIPATGNHTLTHKTDASTCSEHGYEYDYCSVCEGVFNKVELPLEPHIHASKVTKAPTCEEDGVRTYECVCGDKYTEVIPAIGHKFEDGVCLNCSKVENIASPENSPIVIDREKKLISGIEMSLDTENFLKSLAISEDVTVSTSTDIIGTGTVITITDKETGEVIDTFTAVVFGDYNGDGLADIEDATYFSAIANFEIFDYYEHEYLFMAADVNGDGVVDTMDEEDMFAVTNFEAYIDHTITSGSKVVRY